MSDRRPHIEQAQHNEGLARELAAGGYRFRDWSIIAAFYAAVHYFEARLHDQPEFTHPEASVPISHTEDSVPRTNGRMRYSPHAWREELLRANCDMQTWRAYRVSSRCQRNGAIPRRKHDTVNSPRLLYGPRR